MSTEDDLKEMTARWWAILQVHDRIRTGVIAALHDLLDYPRGYPDVTGTPEYEDFPIRLAEDAAKEIRRLRSLHQVHSSERGGP